MISVNSAIHESQIKLSTGRVDNYVSIKESDVGKLLFETNADLMFFCFALGFHRDCKVPVRSGKPYVNLSSVPIQTRTIATELVLHKHFVKINTPAELWKLVEEYAEAGIDILYESFLKSGQRILMDDIYGEMLEVQF